MSSSIALGIEDLLKHMVDKASLLHSRRMSWEMSITARNQAKGRYEAARLEWLELGTDVRIREGYLDEEMDYFEHIANIYMEDITEYAARQSPVGMECSTVDELYIYFIIHKIGDYQGMLFLPEDLALYETADELGLMVSQRPPDQEPEVGAMANGNGFRE